MQEIPHTYVTIDPDLLGGVPCFTGSRVPVAALFDNLADGLGLYEILDSYPTLPGEQAISALRQASLDAEHHAAASAPATATATANNSMPKAPERRVIVTHGAVLTALAKAGRLGALLTLAEDVAVEITDVAMFDVARNASESIQAAAVVDFVDSNENVRVVVTDYEGILLALTEDPTLAVPGGLVDGAAYALLAQLQSSPLGVAAPMIVPDAWLSVNDRGAGGVQLISLSELLRHA